MVVSVVQLECVDAELAVVVLCGGITQVIFRENCGELEEAFGWVFKARKCVVVMVQHTNELGGVNLRP
jgi:hypothetical protein